MTVGLEPKQGFALVDALTALVMLATVIALALSVVGTSRRLAAAASETHQAVTALNYLLVLPLQSQIARSGESSAFTWRVALASASAPAHLGVPMCQRSVVLQSRKSQRGYQAESLEPCPLAQRQ